MAHDLQAALARIDTAYDNRINTASNQAATTQGNLDNLVAEKQSRIDAVNDYVSAENEKVSVDARLVTVPPELV